MSMNEHGLARIQVAATLRRMREQSGVTREQAASELFCTPSKIGDIERGRSGIKPLDLDKLLDLYRVDGGERDLLVQTARTSRKRRGRSEPAIPLTDQRLFDLESQARSVTFFSPELLPGFLQTDDYARALMEWGGLLTVREIDERLAVRAARRKIMTRSEPDPPKYWCTLGEASLRANVGGPQIMAAQLEHLLISSADLRNLVIQVLPLGSGSHWLMGLTHTLLRFDPPAGDVLHADTLGRSVFLDGPLEIEHANHVLELMKAKALDLDDSRDMIQRLVREYKEMSGHAALE